MRRRHCRNARNRKLEYCFSKVDALDFLTRVQTVLGSCVDAETYRAVMDWMVGVYGDWKEHRVQRMLSLVTMFWEDVMVGQRIGGASMKKVDSIFGFRETAICMFLDAHYVLKNLK